IPLSRVLCVAACGHAFSEKFEAGERAAEGVPKKKKSTTLRRLPPAPPATMDIGSIRLASLFLTLLTRWLTGQHVISSDGYGLSMPFSRPPSTGSSPSQAGQVSGFRITGMRLWISPHSSLGLVVMIAKLRTHSPAGERQFSHRPANAIRRRSASAIA